jgi:Putative addiction module component
VLRESPWYQEIRKEGHLTRLSCEHLWDTTVGYNCGIQLWDTTKIDDKAINMLNAEHADLLKLSPSERLLLVQDLWDSLNPEDIPLTDWQKLSLTAERRHMKQTLLPVVHGKRCSAVSSNGMVKSIRFTPEAEDDSYRGYAWYESRRIGLGREFITAVDACLQSISRNPKL